jgi:hypothetical protein
LVFVVETYCVLCEVRTEVLCVKQMYQSQGYRSGCVLPQNSRTAAVMRYTHKHSCAFSSTPSTAVLYGRGGGLFFVLFVTWSIGLFGVCFPDEALVKCFRKLRIIVCRNQEAVRYTVVWIVTTHTHTHAHTHVRVVVFTNTANLGRAWIRRIKTYCIWLRPVKRVPPPPQGLELQQNPSCYSLLPSSVLSFCRLSVIISLISFLISYFSLPSLPLYLWFSLVQLFEF